jgi:carbonic anhydrase
MCKTCDERSFDRRRLFGLAGLGLSAAAMTAIGGGFGSAWAAEGATTLSADKALEALQAGNARYVSDPQVCQMELSKQRAGVAKSQAPWAVILGCADSRVAPELLFGGLGVGQLFVARNAGNVVDTATMGTLEYGTEHLGAPLVVVLGHERCGAVVAACDVVANKTEYPGSIGAMLQSIIPAAQAMQGQPGDFVDNTVRESARRTAARIATASPILAHLIKDKKLKIVAARYDLDDGKVEFIT